MKKRIISVLLATVFALSVIGCGTKDTKEQDAYRQYGITCMESGKYEDAVKAFQNALGESIGHIGEKELDICFYKAKAQALDGKTKDALATYNAIIKYNKDARAYYLRGDLYMDMGEEKKGKADFESAVQHGKKNYEIYIGIYESLSRHEKKDEGQKYLSAAMEIKGDKPEDELYKGRISYLLGENKDAISYLEKAKEHKQMLASYYLGLAYDANGDSDKAKKCIAEYIKSGVATSYDLYELGMQEMQDGNYKNALTHMYNLAIRGGGKLSNYSFSFNAIDQEGLFINDDMQRYNSRLSFDSDVSKRFKVGAALGYTMTKRHSGAAGEEMGITREWNVRPDVPVYDETGELYRFDGTPT